MNHLPKRKQIRLGRDLYRIPETIISVTVGVDGRRHVLEDPDFTGACISLLEVRSEQQNVSILVYCFMPEHLHLLVAIQASGDLVEFMRDFKSRSTRLAWQHGHHGRLWQRGYYDHILREHEDATKHVRYILGNPVRSNLVERWNEYPWIGSFVFDIHLPENWEPPNDW